MRVITLLTALIPSMLVPVPFDTGTILGPGNAMNFLFNPSTFPGGAPAGWGQACGLFIIGPHSGGAFWYVKRDPNTTGAKIGLEFMLLQSTMEVGKAVTIAISKADAADIYSADRNWRLYLINLGDAYRFYIVVGQDDETHAVRFSDVVKFRQVYTHKVTYDIGRALVTWELDGVVIHSVDFVSTSPLNMRYHFIGSSGSSSGRNIIFAVDNVTLEDLP